MINHLKANMEVGPSELQHDVMLCVAEHDPTLGLKFSSNHYRVVTGLMT